jgi:HD-GYP domain
VILAFSAFSLPRALHNMRLLLVVEGCCCFVILALGASALIWPGLVPSVPAPNSTEAFIVLAIGLAAFALLIVRTFRTFLLTQRALDLTVLVGLVWLATATVPALTMNFSQARGGGSAIEIELDGILVVCVAVAIDLARAAQSRPLAGDLRGADLVAAEDVFLGSHVRALMVRLSDKDEYTERHTRRVALRAVQVGEALGLTGGRLRTLAIGGLVHDIGKLSSRTDPEEAGRARPRRVRGRAAASGVGHEAARRAGRLHGAGARARHEHHERLDGQGYPRGLAAEQLDLDTRILTACDVYDALISKRVYRPAWTHDEAMAYLRDSRRRSTSAASTRWSG